MNSLHDDGTSTKNSAEEGTTPIRPTLKESGDDRDPITLISTRDKRFWTSVYEVESRRRQRLEGWSVFFAIVISIIAIGSVWRIYHGLLRCLVLALLGGVLGGLLQDAKFFYKSVGDGNWIWDKSWWRLHTPLLSGAMGFSVYTIFKGFGDGQVPPAGKEDYYAYGIGFLTGLFADNAIQKLRDIAYAVFGTPKDPLHKPHAPRREDLAGISTATLESGAHGSNSESEHPEGTDNGGH